MNVSTFMIFIFFSAFAHCKTMLVWLVMLVNLIQ